MGSSKCRSQVRQIFWLPSRLVGIGRLDGVLVRRFSGLLLCLMILQYLTLRYHPQLSANYVASQVSIWEVDFPGGAQNNNVKWRAFIWAMSEGFLLLAVAVNYLPPRLYSLV